MWTSPLSRDECDEETGAFFAHFLGFMDDYCAILGAPSGLPAKEINEIFDSIRLLDASLSGMRRAMCLVYFSDDTYPARRYPQSISRQPGQQYGRPRAQHGQKA